ncbi:uncharacterized protein N0V89_011603 [Didymosphaeria variabile]|uniref:Uncharacterized protein n=1 Tax=Didymosphaeria variabile TaxID=1932322 RepID=A0A9W8XA20_9PLEO|nr:uncharacterized protein N0V89_011603 [Didymosphaeria variabile]KAJ4345472.1 hypothetical protein N0V89_011603 [Didymosphaeria variabile]
MSPIYPYEHNLGSPSDDGAQLRSRIGVNPRSNAPSAEFTRPHIDADLRGPSSSPFSPFPSLPALNSQVRSYSPLQQSLESRYSPPNLSAVSSSITQPVTPPFQRPSRPPPELSDNVSTRLGGTKERNHDNVSHLQDRNMPGLPFEDDEGVGAGSYDYGKGLTMYEGIPLDDRDLRRVADTPTRKHSVSARDYKAHKEASAVNRLQFDWLDDVNETPPVTDDASDVMNTPIDGGEGFVVPRFKDVESMDPEELDDLMEAMFDPDFPPDHPASPHLFRRSPSESGRPPGRPISRFASPSASCVSGSAHVQFAANASVQDTPFAKTLKYFKQFKDKENTPSKSRRNASLPEEIAELAKEAQQEGVEDEKVMWDKYREIDLAPMDPITDDEMDVDLITGTSTRKTAAAVGEDLDLHRRSGAICIRPKTRAFLGDDKNGEQTSASLGLNDKVIEGYANETGPMYLVDIPGHFGDAFHLQFRSRASVELIATFLRERGEALDASRADIDRLVESFHECPSKFKISGPSDSASSYSDDGCFDLKSRDNEQGPKASSASTNDRNYVRTTGDHSHEKQMILYQEDPVFVKIIGMLPEAAFWVVARPIAHYSSKVLDAASRTFDTALHKLTGLSLDESRASE